jgi:hypothetical protein
MLRTKLIFHQFKPFSNIQDIKSLILESMKNKYNDFLWLILEEYQPILNRSLLFKLQEFVHTEQEWKTLTQLYYLSKIEPSNSFLIFPYEKKKNEIYNFVEMNSIGEVEKLLLDFHSKEYLSNDEKIQIKTKFK